MKNLHPKMFKILVSKKTTLEFDFGIPEPHPKDTTGRLHMLVGLVLHTRRRAGENINRDIRKSFKDL